MFSNRVFLHCFQVALCQRLRGKVKLEEERMSKVKVFQPCFSVVVTGRCHGQHTYPMAHDLDAKWFNRRARFYLLQIIILHSIHIIPRCEEFPERIGSGGKLGYCWYFMRRHLSSTPSDQKVVVATGKRSESFVLSQRAPYL